MARIVYAASGDGLGHATRAHSVGGALLERGHDVRFISCLRGSKYLAEQFPDRVVDIFGFHLACENGRLDPLKSARLILKTGLPKLAPTFRQIDRFIDEFEPDLLITDAEWFSPWAAIWRNLDDDHRRLPCVSLDNQHLLTHCDVELPPGLRRDYWLARSLIRFFNFGVRRYLVSTFIHAPIRYGPTTLLPPVLRKHVYSLSPSRGSYLVAYFGALGGVDHMRKALESVRDVSIRAYGFGLTGQHGPVTYKPTSAEAFLNDLAGCAGVISSAGHSLISECFYFDKPMLLVPIQGQYEQVLNGYHIEKMQVGQCTGELSPRSIDHFLSRLDHFHKHLRHEPKASMMPVVEAVERELG